MTERNIEARLHCIQEQSVDMRHENWQGRILDVGGGGEGIIGQLAPESVVAIDLRKEELEEAPDGPLKIVMDACAMQFVDQTFDVVTAFFSLMYIRPEDHERVFAGIYRVLKPGGRLYLWDVTIPGWPGGEKDIFLVPLEIQMPGRVVHTSYGVAWTACGQTVSHFRKRAEAAGFSVNSSKRWGELFQLVLQK